MTQGNNPYPPKRRITKKRIEVMKYLEGYICGRHYDYPIHESKLVGLELIKHEVLTKDVQHKMVSVFSWAISAYRARLSYLDRKMMLKAKVDGLPYLGLDEGEAEGDMVYFFNKYLVIDLLPMCPATSWETIKKDFKSTDNSLKKTCDFLVENGLIERRHKTERAKRTESVKITLWGLKFINTYRSHF